MLFFRINSFFRHFLRSFKTKRGFGVHSPFAFSFITDIVYPETASAFYCFEKIEQLRHQFAQRNKTIQRKDGKTVSLKSESKTSASPAKDGQLLFRIALFQQSRKIVELGTSLGFGTAYLSCQSKLSEITTIDHDQIIQKVAQDNAAQLHLHNIRFISGDFDKHLLKELKRFSSIDFIFFDGHHKGDASLHYFNTSLPFVHDKTVFVFHDIHWSKDMYQAWLKIYSHPQVSASFELMNIGIVFFNSALNKEHFYA